MYYIFDNGGKTVDRYTLINKDGDVFGFSADPFSPLGIGQFSHNCDGDVKEFTCEGMNEFIAGALLDPDWLGVRIKLNQLSIEAQRFVNERM